MPSRIITLLIMPLLAVLVTAQPLSAVFTIHKGKIIDADFIPTMSSDEHFNAGAKALEENNWSEASRHFSIIVYHFPHASHLYEALFYQGVAFYQLDEYDSSNDAFTTYLNTTDHPKLFTEAIEYKYAIAEKLRVGAKRRLFGAKRMPKWGSGETLAVELYDEVIAALPCHELAAHALYGKGLLHWSQREYQESISSLQAISKRFPKHELAPESYLTITKVYLSQCSAEFQNPDLLALAQLNVHRFKQQFPHEERLALAESDLLAIKEIYGQGLYDTGAFYERVSKPSAATIYYQNALSHFPETRAAQSSKVRLNALRMPPSDEETDGCS